MDFTQVTLDSQYIMFKGEPGLLKSTQALSYPGPQYWFSWDQKMNALALPIKDWGIDPKTIHFDDYSDWTAPRKKLIELQVNCPYKTLIFDSITSCADFTIGQTLKLKQGTTSKSGAAKGITIGNISVADIEDYNAESSALQELIALTKDIKKFHKVNIILIAHVIQAEYRNGTNNTTHISRTIVTAGKKVAAKIPAYCDEVYHFNLKKGFDANVGGTYEILTSHTGDDFARTTLPLERSIDFGKLPVKPLYNTWILPAINKLKG